jgi:hypothetical protein
MLQQVFTTALNWYFGVGLACGYSPDDGWFIVLPFVVITFQKDD